jgi:rare lipoprotein A
MVSGLRLAALMRARLRTAMVLVGLAATLAACSSAPPSDTTGQGSIPNRIAGGRYKVGAPYQAGGLWYVPAEQPRYDVSGLASWYGDDFHGKATANGEIFDMTAVSAAHATLPLPSMVEVTNLDNGRSITVRVNDRGPYKSGRIIDLSRGAAEALGYRIHGLAHVRVRYLGPGELPGAPSGWAQTARSDTPPPVTPAPAAQPVQQASAPNPPSRASSPEAAAGLAVQAGAFADKGAAERLAVRLSAVGRTVVSPVQRGPVTLWRVTVGEAADRAGADQLRLRLAAYGVSDGRIVAAP